MKIGLIADLAEEGWPSMDLVAESLSVKGERLEVRGGKESRESGKVVESGSRNTDCEMRNGGDEIELIRPPMRRRFSKANAGRGYTADRLLNRFWDYPRFLQGQRKRELFDVYHLADHSYSQLVHALPANRTVVTCHDVDTFRCLWETDHAGRGWAFRAMTRRILSGLQKAAHVACDSRATQEELIAQARVAADRTSVVPLGLRDGLLAPASEEAGQRVDELMGRAQLGEVCLLHVGSTIERKRIDVLLEVFARVRGKYPAARLLRVGGRFTPAQQGQMEQLGLPGSVTVLPFLSVAELAEVYRRADLVLLPSDAEGFGFPVIEAMACGTPILVSDLPVLREVGGEAASYSAVGKIDDWVQKIEQLLQHRERDRTGWEQRREMCRRQGQQFTWQETRRRMQEIYREVWARATADDRQDA